MGNVIRNILDSLRLTDEDDFDEADSIREAAEEDIRKSKEAKEATKNKSVLANETFPSTQKKSDPKSKKPREAQTVNKTTHVRNDSLGLEVCVIKPAQFEEAQDICDILLDNRPVIVNLNGIELTLAQRIMDFVSGSVYSLNGKLHQVSDFIFIISPDSVEITGDYIESLMQNGFEVPTFTK